LASKAQFAHGTVAQRLDLALSRELHEGESVVWKGMKLARIEPKGFAIYLFAIPWTAFALFWMSMAGLGASQMDGGIMAWAFPLFGLPFVLIGLGMMATPFLSYFQRGRVLFAVTDQRVLKLSMGSELTVNSVPADKVADSVRRESSDGSGSIDLSLSADVTGYGGRRSRKMEFGRVEGVFDAYQAIEKLTGKSSS
jgi:hypothetical protein